MRDEFQSFSKELVRGLAVYVMRDESMQRFGVPSYSELEELCTDEGSAGLNFLTKEQEEDYDLFYKNRGNLIQYIGYNFESPSQMLQRREKLIYDTLIHHWNVRNLKLDWELINS